MFSLLTKFSVFVGMGVATNSEVGDGLIGVCSEDDMMGGVAVTGEWINDPTVGEVVGDSEHAATVLPTSSIKHREQTLSKALFISNGRRQSRDLTTNSNLPLPISSGADLFVFRNVICGTLALEA